MCGKGAQEIDADNMREAGPGEGESEHWQLLGEEEWERLVVLGGAPNTKRTGLRQMHDVRPSATTCTDMHRCAAALVLCDMFRLLVLCDMFRLCAPLCSFGAPCFGGLYHPAKGRGRGLMKKTKWRGIHLSTRACRRGDLLFFSPEHSCRRVPAATSTAPRALSLCGMLKKTWSALNPEL